VNEKITKKYIGTSTLSFNGQIPKETSPGLEKENKTTKIKQNKMINLEKIFLNINFILID